MKIYAECVVLATMGGEWKGWDGEVIEVLSDRMRVWWCRVEYIFG
jgi:hypothetical protein